jgi:glycosyltransferase involved in cell wall biosynthesis
LDNSINLITVGRISVEKSLDIAFQAFRIILIYHPEIKFIIVGDGPYKNQLEKIVNKFNLKEKIIFTGTIPNKKLIKENYYRSGDIFVTASKTETQGICIMEAMAFGLPIVAVKAKASPEIIKHNQNGFLANPDDSVDIAKYINKLIKNPELRKKFGKNSLKQIKEHSIKNVVDELEKIYQELIKKNKKKKTKLIKLKSKYKKVVKEINDKIKELNLKK